MDSGTRSVGDRRQIEGTFFAINLGKEAEKMNVWKEMSAFRDWLLLNEMSSSGIVLWYSLFNIWNKVDCQCKFNVPNPTLMKLTGLSKHGLINARATLIQHWLIRYEKGKKGSALVYQLHSLVHTVDSLLYQLITVPINDRIPSLTR